MCVNLTVVIQKLDRILLRQTSCIDLQSRKTIGSFQIALILMSLSLVTVTYATKTTTGVIAVDDPLGNFRTFCDFSHAAPDDPIVSPGQTGGSHLHFFFGNTLTNAYTTTTSLRRSGSSTCQGTQFNKSAYWIPALFNSSGDPVLPSTTDIYYKNQTVENPRSIRALPAGLRIIAGDATGIKPDPYNLITAWWCESAGVGSRSKTIPDCAVGDRLRMFVVFPHCWDGVRLDSHDHQSHMADAVWSNQANGTLCPDSHPVVVPRISYNFTWLLSERSRDWFIASDRHQGRNMPGGSTLHGDWWNGWHLPTLEIWTEHCLRQTRDCSNGDLGNGQILDERYASGSGVIRRSLTGSQALYCNGRRATLVGTNGDDVLNGTVGDDVIVSFAGNDRINGGNGNDVICSGPGADVIFAGAGDDEVRTGSGNDRIFGGDGDDRLWGQAGNDVMIGEDGDDALQGGTGDDTLRGDFGHDYLSGGPGSDNLNGGLLNDVLNGGSGDDVLRGSWQNDRIFGSAGADRLYGDQDDDRLWGGSGEDACLGGEGNDRVISCE